MAGAPATTCDHAGHGCEPGRDEHTGRGRSAWRGPALLAGIAAVLIAVPVLVGRMLDPSIADQTSICPFLHATGVPCPACGATRAFVLLMHGDGGGALSFNWAWIAVWALALAAIAVAAWRLLAGRPAVPEGVRTAGRWLQAHPFAVVALPFVLLAGPWAVALANIGAIR